MKIGTLVKHIEYEYVGIIVDRDDISSQYWIYWGDKNDYDWYTDCELEVLCK